MAGGVGISGVLNVGIASTFFNTDSIAGFAGSRPAVYVDIQNTSTDEFANAGLRLANNLYNSAGLQYFSSTSGPGYLNALFIYNTSGDTYLQAGTGRIVYLNIGGVNLLTFTSLKASIAQTAASTSSTTGGLTVVGGVGIGKTSYFGQDVKIQGSTASTNSTTGALIVSGGVGIGGSLWTSTSNLASISGVTLNNGTVTGALSGNATTSTSAGSAGTAVNAGFAGAATTATTAGSAGTSVTAGSATTATNAGNAGSATTATNAGFAGSATTATSAGTAGTATNAGSAGTSVTAGSAGTANNSANINVVLDTTSTIYLTGSRSNASIGATAAYVLSGVSALGNTLSASGVNVTGATTSTGTGNGALVVTGGVGIGGSLWTAAANLSSISGVTHLNGAILSGAWAGTAISAVNGGTGQNTYAIGDILYASSSTALSKLSAGTAGSVLTSNGAGTAPSYKAVSGGGSPAGSSSFLQYNNAGSFGATSHLAYGGNGNNDFVISSPFSGANQGQINIGMGITAFDAVSLGKFAGSASGTIIAVNYATGFAGNFADFQLAGIFLGQLVEHRSNHFAGTTPGRPKIYQCWNI